MMQRKESPIRIVLLLQAYSDSVQLLRLVMALGRIHRGGLNLLNSWNPKPRLNMELFHGSNWRALTLAAEAYEHGICDANSKVQNFCGLTFASDEQFFQTGLRNSTYAESCGPVAPHLGRGTYRTASPHLIDPSLEKWFNETDTHDVLSSGSCDLRTYDSPESALLLRVMGAKCSRHIVIEDLQT